VHGGDEGGRRAHPAAQPSRAAARVRGGVGGGGASRRGAGRAGRHGLVRGGRDRDVPVDDACGGAAGVGAAADSPASGVPSR